MSYRSAVKVKKYLNAEEVDGIICQVKTFSGTPEEPKASMTEEQVSKK